MKYYYDLHIHSCLSPCGDNDMTPNNIVNMADVCGLDFVAATDHNCCYNLPAILECAQETDIIVICGMEIETSEEVHIIALFPSLEQCQKMCEIVMNALPNIPNNEKIFGEQLIMDSKDIVASKVERLLSTATQLSVYDIIKLTSSLGGVAYPAHVDKSSFSIISNLGFIPDDLNLTAIELSKNTAAHDFLSVNPTYGKYNIIQSSDAHYLQDIFERKSFVDLKEKSAEALIECIKGI